MPFYQNPFSRDFRGNWVLADRKQVITFPSDRNTFRNRGRGDEMVVVWNEGPYDLSGNDADGNPTQDLYITFALDVNDFKNWASIHVDISGAAPAATTPAEIVATLNADEVFASYFTAELAKFPSGTDRVVIRQKLPVTRLRFYICNGNAEEALRFNARADVAEMPDYFDRHKMSERENFDDCMNMLIELDNSGWAAEGDTVDGDVIYHALDEEGRPAGLDPTDPKEDWEHLEGRSGLFVFKKNCLDGDNIVQSIEYHAGARAGDLAKKTCYVYDGNAQPIQVTEEPYVLTEDDLITPDCSECSEEEPE